MMRNMRMRNFTGEVSMIAFLGICVGEGGAHAI
jgi:hypothetical protein